jgi:SCF-associated factor 1
MTALDIDGEIWCFTSWGKPFIYAPPILETHLSGDGVIQVESGSSFSCALNSSGMVFIWKPTWPDTSCQCRSAASTFDPLYRHNEAELAPNDIIQCCGGRVAELDPILLPDLPHLPPLYDEDEACPPQLTNIAAGDQFMIGLTNYGHILKFDLTGIDNQSTPGELASVFNQRHWQYVSGICTP